MTIQCSGVMFFQHIIFLRFVVVFPHVFSIVVSICAFYFAFSRLLFILFFVYASFFPWTHDFFCYLCSNLYLIWLFDFISLKVLFFNSFLLLNVLLVLSISYCFDFFQNLNWSVRLETDWEVANFYQSFLFIRQTIAKKVMTELFIVIFACFPQDHATW